ncbi:MAG: hypothetical protein ACLUMK_09555 [Christensenellales bacterium]
MGEMLLYLLVAAFFVIVEVIAVGKKKKRPAAKLHEPKRAAPPETTQKQADETARERARVFEQADEFDDPCEQEAEPRIHLHHADEQAMEQAGEGEDPCHAGAAPERPPMDDETAKTDVQRAAFQSDVLRGVIMSEILTRPGERAAVRRMKRGR